MITKTTTTPMVTQSIILLFLGLGVLSGAGAGPEGGVGAAGGIEVDGSGAGAGLGAGASVGGGGVWVGVVGSMINLPLLYKYSTTNHNWYERSVSIDDVWIR
jgi:hypothetical protein